MKMMKKSKKRITLAEFKKEACKQHGVRKQYISDKEGWVEDRANNLVVNELVLGDICNE